MAFCPFVNALVWLLVSAPTIIFATCSCQSPIFLVIFHPPVPETNFLFSFLWLILPLNSVTYLRVVFIPWVISKALLNVKALSNNNLLCVFSSFLLDTILPRIIISSANILSISRNEDRPLKMGITISFLLIFKLLFF